VINTYDVIYLLKPEKEVEPGWWKLKWKPIFRQTYSFYCMKVWGSYGLAFYTWTSHAQNGWHRSFKHRHFELQILNYRFSFWVRWRFIVHQDGPSDATIKRPLDLSGVGKR
jgi:hypothetical protein